jgi:hypothetical protein
MSNPDKPLRPSGITTVIAEMSMSLDGFIADEKDAVEELFGWYANGGSFRAEASRV